MTESIELLDRLLSETGAHPAAVVANRVLPVMFDRRQQLVADRLPEALDLMVEEAGVAVEVVLEAAQLAEARRRTGAEHLYRLSSALADGDLADLPVVTVPELFVRSYGPRVVSLVADALSDELDVDVIV